MTTTLSLILQSMKEEIVFSKEQKPDYIHNNPVKAGLCRLPEDYKYSSARFYERNEKDLVFLTHHDG
jgi:hypothetical protein